MTIKTIEELNREFLDEYIHEDETKTRDIIPLITTGEVIPFTATDSIEAGEERDSTIDESESAIATEDEAAGHHLDRSSPPRDKPAAKSRSAASKQPVWKDMLYLLIKIAMILLVFAILFTFLFGFERYGEPSMAPAIKDGDLVIYYRYTKVGYLPQDTIMLEHNGQTQARRVIAVEGDEVDITEHGVMINGAVQLESDIRGETERYEEGVSFPLTVPEGHVFVLGDNREGATDSRIYGPVNIDDTLGKVMAVIRRRSI